jgi:cytochrome oxidase assembly protein ShyY1
MAEISELWAVEALFDTWLWSASDENLEWKRVFVHGIFENGKDMLLITTIRASGNSEMMCIHH